MSGRAHSQRYEAERHSKGSPVHEAVSLAKLVRVGTLSVEQARKLIAINDSEKNTLLKILDRHHAADVIAKRSAILREFDRLVSAKGRNWHAVDPMRESAKKSKSSVLNADTGESTEKWAD